MLGYFSRNKKFKNEMELCSERYLPLGTIFALLLFVIVSHKMINMIVQTDTETTEVLTPDCPVVTCDRSVTEKSIGDRPSTGTDVTSAGTDISGNKLPPRGNLSSEFDFEGPCSIAEVIKVLYDPNHPLTTQDLLKLRGCMVLLFFRSPRCGSTSVYYLFNELSVKLGYESIMIIPRQIGSRHNWVEFIDNRTVNRQPIAVSCHHKVEDMIDEPIKPAAMINIIRHPINHMVSIFKLRKYGDRQETPNEERDMCNMTFSDYLLKYGFEQPCIADGYMGLRYLTGGVPCDKRSECLQQAKTNIETFYLAVGVSENIPAFLFVMETLLPQFLDGGLNTYSHMSGLYQMFSPDPYRDEVITPAAMSYLNKELASDFELYHYVQQRQYLAMKKILEYRGNNDLKDNAYLRHRIEPPDAK